MKLQVPNDIKQIHKLFKQNGKKLYVVGGAVRDAILGKKPKDFDLATDAKPDEVERIAQRGGLKTLGVGKQFGVVLVQTPDTPEGHEIATFRKDIGKGRRPAAVDYTDIEGDVKRRDLTVNALFYDLDKDEIVDLVGGIADLQKGRVQTVGKAQERFDEDPLRKLRALRFAGLLGGKLATDTFASLKRDPSLKGVSAERIRDEFIKGIQKSKKVSQYMNLTDRLNFFPEIFPGMNVSKEFIDSKNHKIQLAWMLRNNKLDTLPSALNKLKYTNQEIIDIIFMINLIGFDSTDIFDVKKAQEKISLSRSELMEWGKLIHRQHVVANIIKFKLTVRGGDVANMGFRGPQIGQKVKDMEAEKFSSLNEGTLPPNLRTFKDFVKSAPPDLQRRIMNMKNIPQNTKHHPEGNVLKHTILVVNNALKYDDIDMAIAAVVHDIGKDETLDFNSKTGQPTAHGHETVSAGIVKDYRAWIRSIGGNPVHVYYLVKQHMRVKNFSDMKPAKQQKLKQHPLHSKLMRFNDADNNGRYGGWKK